MSLNDKAILPDDHALDALFALRPSTSIVESGNGEWTPSAPLGAAEPLRPRNCSPIFTPCGGIGCLPPGWDCFWRSIAGSAVWFIMGARYTADAYLQCNFQQDRILDGNTSTASPRWTNSRFSRIRKCSMMTEPHGA